MDIQELCFGHEKNAIPNALTQNQNTCSIPLTPPAGLSA